MISVSEAKQIIEKNITPLSPVSTSLQYAAGKILAEDIISTIDIPAFPQSSMDGYAFAFADWQKNKMLTISGESAAGTEKLIALSAGTAVRIFTGAPVPPGADTVVMQEKTRVENLQLNIEDEKLVAGMNVRLKGSEISTGEPALPKGTLLTPAAMAFLAGIGTTAVKIYPSPAVSIILTGNELQEPGKTLQYGQVYESNSFSLRAALQQLDIRDIKIYKAEDKLETLTDVLKNALEQSDMVLLTGGVSVGEYDFVLKAADACGVQTLFHKIKQRPGKPLFFGKKNNKAVFGLPGNPSSVLTCFYEYVMPALGLLSKKETVLHAIKVPLSGTIAKPQRLTQFLKAKYDGETVTPLNAQESYRMHSFARANCFIVAEEETTDWRTGDIVEIHLLPS